MNHAYILFINILVMLIYAVPGYLLIKSKLIKADAIAGLNALLLFVAQPCLVYYSLSKVAFEPRILWNMLYTFLISFVIMFLAIGGFFLLTKKKQQEHIVLRIANVAIGFGNCTFMGLPLLEALLPHYPEAAIYSMFFFLSMSILGWTFVCYIISGDRKYISIKKIVCNPATISLAVCMPFFICNYALPEPFHSSINLMGRMCTPLCMIILGIRLGTIPLPSIVTAKTNYFVIALRQLIVPMIYVLACLLLPIEPNLKTTLVICGSTPVAAVVLNYAELMGEGQKQAAGIIILSTVTSVVTMPFMILLYNFIV